MTLVTADLVFAQDRWRERHGLVLQGGRILATGEPGELAEGHPGHEREDWGHVAVLPGTVNGHGHSFQSLLTGFGDDLPFSGWHDLGIENDLAVVEAAREVGIRLVLARSMFDWTGAPRRYQETTLEAERNFRELRAALHGDHQVFVQPAPHSIHAASPDMIRQGASLAMDLGLPFHIHVAEQRSERDRCIERHGVSPVAFLDAMGVLSDRTVMVHGVWVDERDLAIMRDRAVRVVHCPGANAFLGDGIAPVRQMLERNIPVCLGTDGGFANSRRSVFEEMRMAALVARAAEADGAALGGDETLLMGTARGGEALDLPVGRIAADHAADLVVIDLDALSVQPARTAPRQIVYSMQPEAIVKVIVGGEPVVERGRPARVDEREIVAKVQELTRGWRPAEADAFARRR